MIAVLDRPISKSQTITIPTDHPLHMPAKSSGDYRTFLWQQMQCEDDTGCKVWVELYRIANLIWTCQPFTIDYPHAPIIIAAVKKVVIADLVSPHRPQQPLATRQQRIAP